MRALALIPLLLAACADDLEPTAPDAGADDAGGDDPPAAHVEHTDHGDGTTTTRVDASAMDAWVHLDLDGRAEVDADGAWELGFQRFAVTLDGGISGDGEVAAAALDGADFDALTVAPADGYVVDAVDGDDEDGEPDLALAGWYAYDPTTHVLTPVDRVYVIRSSDGGYFKLRFLDYYDDAGTSGFPTFRWGPVDPPGDAETLTVDASDPEAWVEVDLDGGGWDLAFSRTRIRTNGGTSGTALGGARLAPEGAAYQATTAATTIGYVADAMIPIPGPPGSGEFSGNPVLNGWYDYDPSTHVVTSKQLVYLIRTATGDHAKLQILDYASGVLTVRLAPVARDVTVQTTTKPRSSRASPALVRAGG